MDITLFNKSLTNDHIGYSNLSLLVNNIFVHPSERQFL